MDSLNHVSREMDWQGRDDYVATSFTWPHSPGLLLGTLYEHSNSKNRGPKMGPKISSGNFLEKDFE
jgi:hypothetical protein